MRPAAPVLDALLAERTRANQVFFVSEAERIGRLCHEMSERFARGGRLIALGASAAARSDARHVAVEFVHPVIVGKRALPAVALESAAQAALLAGPDDMVLAFDGDVPARCFPISIPAPPSDDPFVRQELAETLYHVLWELVHVFFEHPGLLEGRSDRRVHDAGGASFLYPFLAEQEHDVEAVLADVERSVLMKAREVAELREQTLTEGRDALVGAASALRRAFEAGGKALAFGNGGSATDAADLVADLRAAPEGWPPRAALDLTEDSGILTALANDVGPEVLFQRQVIAYGREGDVAVALSTSGGSGNVVEALAEARRRGLATIALVGYDGGRVAAEELADQVVVSRSQHVPRIQEAQASAYHVLRELVELA
jgi:D-sedoheptulose 7-phosphate isomerase